ncbi:hypothetical protein NP1_33 [Xanthomonas phage NP1]|nr:hypothetical protein NP1_33 [Xanthomonas phage NP1]
MKNDTFTLALVQNFSAAHGVDYHSLSPRGQEMWIDRLLGVSTNDEEYLDLLGGIEANDSDF